MPSPIGSQAASKDPGSLYRSPCTMMAHAIRAILLAKATAATLVGRRAINRPSQGRFSVPCFCVANDRHRAGDKQPPQVSVALFGDAAEPVLATA